MTHRELQWLLLPAAFYFAWLSCGMQLMAERV